MKNCILHFPWKINENHLSTPDIRAQKMHDAFVNIGYGVDVIWGSGKERKKSVRKVIKKLEK